MASDGTNKDIRCNIYDMASNIMEWTTETYYANNTPCTRRGCNFNNTTVRVSERGPFTDKANEYTGFRRNNIYKVII